MDAFVGDLRSILRGLRARPGFSLVVVTTVALGIGANTALFSLVSGILLRPLPYRDPGEIVTFFSSGPSAARDPFSIPDYLDLGERTRTLAGIGAWSRWGANLTGEGEPELLQGVYTAPGTLALLGVEPVLGRLPLAEEERSGGDRVVLLGHRLWKRRFAAEPAVLGRVLTLNAERFTIVGVLPPDFILPGRDVDVVVPLLLDADGRRAARAAGFLRPLGRLEPGVSLTQADADLDRIAEELQRQYPETNATKTGVTVAPLHEEIVGRVRPMILALQGAVALVLAIGCANLANLLLSRAGERRQELAIRSALGASRPRLARLLVGETVLLCVLGGALGLLVARAGMDVLLAMGPGDLPRRAQVEMNAPVALFALGLSLLTGLLCGLLPALRATRDEAQPALKEGGRAATDETGRVTRRWLVSLEVGLALVLLTGASLLVQSFVRLGRVDPGFEPASLLTARLSLPRARYADPMALGVFHDRLALQLEDLPGVRSVAAASVIPLHEWRATIEFTVVGRPPARPDETPIANYRMVSPRFFSTLGIPLRRGRSFTDADTAGSAPVAVVNETLARRFLSDQDPVGAFLVIDDSGRPPRKVEVVGVVGDVKHYGLDDPPSLDVYVPMRQIPQAVAVWLANNMSFVVRTEGDPLALAGALRKEVRAADPQVPASAVRSMEQALHASLGPRRFNLFLIQLFAVAALLLAALGTYAVTAQAVASRTRELGVRIALGAGRGQILALVFEQGTKPVAVGLLLGVLAAVASLRLASGLLFGVSSSDPATLLGVVVLLATVALAAIYAPARRATRVDPIVALRSE